MPSNVRRSCIFVVVSLAFAAVSSAQNVAQATPGSSPAPLVAGPTAGDVMRERITKAKAFIAVRNYNAAVYELENIRKESADDAVRSAANVLLMNSYLEQGDFKRAQDLLTENYNLQKTTRSGALPAYMAVAGQVVKGARSRAERYKALGLNISDRTLPLEALNDLEKMREMVETVVTQSKELAQNPAKAKDGMALMEEATTSRSMIARDDYDSRRWRDVVADTREQMASSRSVVLNAVNDGTGDVAKSPDNTPKDSVVGQAVGSLPTSTASAPVQPVMQPAAQPVSPSSSQPTSQSAADNTSGSSRQREVKLDSSPVPKQDTVAQSERPVYIPSNTPIREEPKPEPRQEPKQDLPQTKQSIPEPAPAVEKVIPRDDSPVDVGSLIGYATHQTQPVYPIAAKTMRATGVVKVEVMVDEKGDVASVKKVSGPIMLQDAAKDAVKKWKFKPFVRDGQPVKASGFVSFNFNI